MENSIIPMRDVENNKEYLGNKTINLGKCAEWGFCVPKFVALPSFAMEKLSRDRGFREETAREIAKILGSKRYSVRSSALIEDNQYESFAGQFKTILNIPGTDLGNGIREVIGQAEVFLKGDLEKFSIIIQEYVAADISGVTFTRDPNGSREMVVEYGFCEGEKIVSGRIRPQRVSFYWNGPGQKLPQAINAELIVKFKDLEKRNEFPQDIEWCVKDGRFYLLQTRPITTISPKQYRQIIYLDGFLQKGERFLYQKTEISEIAPRPTNVTLGLLKAIYSQNGPAAKVYRKYGVEYEDTGFLKIIGNELFIDREKEMRGLLPACGYFGGGMVPKIRRLPGLIVTGKNFFNLNRIKTDNHERIFNLLKERIEASESNCADSREAEDNFMRDYEFIFEANLLAGLSMKKAELFLKNCPVGIAEILAAHPLFIDLGKCGIKTPQSMSGNSIELSDETEFIAQEEIIGEINDAGKKVSEWWKAIGKYNREAMRKTITEAIIYSRFREFGRWLTVKNINCLRRSLLKVAGEKGFRDVRNIYFAELDGISGGDAVELLCMENRKNYGSFNDFNFPKIISSKIGNQKSKIIGISSGIAQGILLDRGAINRESDNNEGIILYTEILSPDLAKFFGRISGIASSNGGLLSHLAIIAREKHVPVVSGIFLPDEGLKLGDFVKIDGGKGTISK